MKPITRQRLFDGAAMMASVACLVHCLLLPLLFVLIPALATFLVAPESIHLAAVLFALPTSAIALTIGYRRHRRLCPVGIATIGLALIAIGATAAGGGMAETLVTVAGSVGLAIGHALNWQAMARAGTCAI